MDFCSKTPEELAEYYAQAVERFNRTDGYAKLSHVRITCIAPGYAEGELEVCPEVLNPMGIVHGGCLTTLADTVTGVAAHSSGLRCVTLNCTMNYLKPGRGSKILCKATVEKSGRTVQVCQAALTGDQGETVATGTFTYYALGPMEQK